MQVAALRIRSASAKRRLAFCKEYASFFIMTKVPGQASLSQIEVTRKKLVTDPIGYMGCVRESQPGRTEFIQVDVNITQTGQQERFPNTGCPPPGTGEPFFKRPHSTLVISLLMEH